MTPRRCDMCRYFDPLGKGGKCRRNSPIIIEVGDVHNDRGVWPWVRAEDWCGSWVNKRGRSRHQKEVE